MGDVIKWSPRDGKSGGMREKGARDERHAVETAQREDENRQFWRNFGFRYGEKSRPKENPALTEADQTRVAQALWLLLDRAKKKNGISKSAVMDRAGIGSKGDAIKHLSQYSLRPDAKPSLKRGLNKKIWPYVRLCRSVAELAGWDEADTLAEVFGDTALASGTVQRTADAAYEALATTLGDICDAVSIKHQLQNYFEKLIKMQSSLRIHGVEEDRTKVIDEIFAFPYSDVSRRTHWDYSDIEHRARSRLSDMIWEDCKFSDMTAWGEIAPVAFRGYSSEGAQEGTGEVASFPLIVLGRWAVGPKFPVKISACSWFDDREGDEMSVRAESTGRLEVEVRLYIVPYGNDLVPRAALRVQPKLTLGSVRAAKGKHFPASENTEASVEVRFETTDSFYEEDECDAETGQGDTIRCSLAFELPKELTHVGSYFDKRDWRADGNALPRFFPVTGRTLEDWLGPDCDDGDMWSPQRNEEHLLVLGPPLVSEMFLSADSDPFSPIRKGTPAHVVDQHIFGRHAHYLVTLLDERAGRLTELLKRACREAELDRGAAAAKLEQHLAKMRCDPSM